MKTICLVRHASAKKNGKTDYSRPLNKSGEKEAKILAQNLKKETGLYFDRIIASPAIRSFETAMIFAKVLGLDENKIELNEAIYSLEPDADLLSSISTLDNSIENILLIGHNPSIENTARKLLSGFSHKFYTASALNISFVADSWDKTAAGSGKFIFYKFNRFNADLSRLDKMIARSIKYEIYSKIENSLKEIETSLLSADLNEGELESEKLADKIYAKTDIITIRSLTALDEEIKKYESAKREKIETKIAELDKTLSNYRKKIQMKNDKKIAGIENKKNKLLKKKSAPHEDVKGAMPARGTSDKE